MEYRQNPTIVEQMQPIFDALPEKLKDEKLRRGLTNQQLSDVSGVPIATTSRIIAGAVSNPGIYHIAPLCEPWVCRWMRSWAYPNRVAASQSWTACGRS